MKNKETGMTLIAKTITRLTVGLILIYGIYIMLQGHLSPGGGVVGGIIVALSFIHLFLAFGKEELLKRLSLNRGLILVCLGAIAFLIVSALKFICQRHCPVSEDHFRLFAVGLPLSELAVTVMVGSGLYVIFLALILLGEGKDRE